MIKRKHIAALILSLAYLGAFPLFAQSNMRPLQIESSGTGKGQMEPIAITANSGTGANKFANGAATQTALDGKQTWNGDSPFSSSWVTNYDTPLRTTGTYDNAAGGGQVEPTIYIAEDGKIYMYWAAWSNADAGSIALSTGYDPLAMTKEGQKLVVSGTGWDSGFVSGPRIHKFGDTYYLYYFGGETPGYETTPSHIGVATASSPEGPWTKHAGNPILTTGTSGTWDDTTLYRPFVVQHEGAYYLYYNALGEVAGPEDIGVATGPSPLGPFTKSESNPILSHADDGGWEDYRVNDPVVYRNGDKGWIMYYGGNKVSPWSIGVGIATSPDLITWTRSPNNPIKFNGSTGAEWRPELAKTADGWLMFYDDGNRIRTARSAAVENLSPRKEVSNAAYTMGSGDRYVAQTGTMSAARSWTLPLAASVPSGTEIVAADESGTPTSVNTITMVASGSDTVVGSAVIGEAYGSLRFRSNNATKWISLGANTTATAALDARYGVTVSAVATANLDRSSDTTPTADPDLDLALTAGTWLVQGRVHISESTVSNTHGSQLRVNCASFTPTGSSMFIRAFAGSAPTGFTSISVPSTGTTFSLPSGVLGAATSRFTYEIQMILVVPSSTTLDVEWAQHTTSATATRRLPGSFMSARKIQ